ENVKGKDKAQEEGVADDSVDDSADDSADDSVDDSSDDHSKAEISASAIPVFRYLVGGKTMPRHHSLLIPTQIPHQLMVPIQTLICTQGKKRQKAEIHPEVHTQGKFRHVESAVMANKFVLCVKQALLDSTSANVKQGVPSGTWKSPHVRKAPARPDADVPSPDAMRSWKQTGSNWKQE
ncbi:hypothetical protein F5J12DRAFT_787747, partial [Pisolithus orientalis]|uniref:uncharacterized protein n=1 Tax=Pisolithus orientalis TaxID=936130 RepID=UPI002224460F